MAEVWHAVKGILAQELATLITEIRDAIHLFFGAWPGTRHFLAMGEILMASIKTVRCTFAVVSRYL
jgi:hypothetical protein